MLSRRVKDCACVAGYDFTARAKETIQLRKYPGGSSFFSAIANTHFTTMELPACYCLSD
jgi:hypothetical protein